MLAMKHNAAQETFRINEVERRSTPQSIVRPAGYMSLGNRISMFVVIVACAAATWFVAAQKAQIDAVNYNIDGLQSQISRLAADDASLTSQVDFLKSPSRILSIVKAMGGTIGQPIQLTTSSTGTH